jgi:diguanylate cyclase (GGDEF)-like protein
LAWALRDRFGAEAVTRTGTLEEALRTAVAGFDLVLTAWTLPDGGGKAVLDALRSHGARGVIVLGDGTACGERATGVGDAAHAEAVEAILGGAVDYILPSACGVSGAMLAVEKCLAAAEVRGERDAALRRLQEQNEAMSQLLKTLEEAASTDPLTGLLNRRQFASVIEAMFADAQRTGSDLACVMLDMDGFKHLNDHFGHQTGDAALELAAREIQANLRRSDAAARYGGDEFVILLPRSGAMEAAAVARRIAESYNAEMTARGYTRLPVGMSFGVASLVADRPEKPEGLVGAADAALYRAKRLGRDMVFISTAPAPRAAAG